MLQRAASNAYSWWWASHIRTKQSKWMEQNLHDMEEKVQVILKMLQEDGDSFARRAEMYYKKRPELISFVEESYRAYRALAERYDHISKELQNANNTIASVCPDQVPYMNEDDEDASPRPPKRMPEVIKPSTPKVPKPPHKDLKTIITAATKKLNPKRTATPNSTPKAPTSGLSKKEALDEIDKLQKQILALQTVKEFVKSSYDNSIARYWQTEEQIKELQERVFNLQDEFGEGIGIADDEARRLMAEAALKTCQETLAQLQVRQEQSIDETKIETKRVRSVREKLESVMNTFHYDQANPGKPKARKDVKEIVKIKDLDEDEDRMTQRRQELQSIQDKIKEHSEAGFHTSIGVTEMAEKIDGLVNKVISLETSVSSQTALVKRLRTETDELQSHIQTLEDDKASLTSEKTDLNNQLREMGEKLEEIQDLNQIVENQNSNLQTHFTEARCNLDHLSEEVQHVKEDERDEVMDLSEREKELSGEAESKYGVVGQDALNKEHVSKNDVKSDKELKVAGLVKNDVNSGKELKDTGLVEDDVKSHNELKVSSSLDKDAQRDNEVKVVDSRENDVKSDNALKVMGSLEKEKASPVESKSPTESKEEEELKVAGLVKNDVNSDKELKDTGLVEDDVKSHNELKVSSSLDKDAQKDNEVKVVDSRENDVKSDNALKVMGSLEKEKASPVESKSPTESKEEEKTLYTGNSDEKAVCAPCITAGDQDVTQHKASNEANSFSESSENQQENDAKKISSETEKTHKVDSQQQEIAQEDEPNWRQLFMDGMQEKEKVLLSEYTNTLRKYKDTKKNLNDVEKKNQDTLFETSFQLKELKTSNVLKDEEIKLLRRRLDLLQRSLEGNEDMAELRKLAQPAETQEIDAIFKIDEPDSTSAIELKFRTDIDEILEENLGFWLKFSTSFTEIQKFETTVKDLQTDASKLSEKGKSSEGSGSSKYSLKSDARPIYQHLEEIQTEITVWLEKSVMLKEELKSRFSSLCEIQDEITKALKSSAEDDDFKFTSYQAAKFQGEVLNMKQENNKVADELQAGLDHVTSLQLEVEKSLAKLGEQFGLSSSKRQQSSQLRHSGSHSRVPLGAFIFGVKPKKPKNSIFSCMTPGMHRKYRALRGQGNT